MGTHDVCCATLEANSDTCERRQALAWYVIRKDTTKSKLVIACKKELAGFWLSLSQLQLRGGGGSSLRSS